MEVEKGVLDLVEAVERIRDNGLDVELALAGSGKLDDRLAELATTRSWLQLHGALQRTELPSFLRALQIFVLPARIMPDHEEHDAHALREALTSGLATIGTRSGVIPDLLADGTGVLVEAGDPLSLSNALERLVTNGTLRNDLARMARAKAERVLLCEAVGAASARIYMNSATGAVSTAGMDAWTSPGPVDRG